MARKVEDERTLASDTEEGVQTTPVGRAAVDLLIPKTADMILIASRVVPAVNTIFREIKELTHEGGYQTQDGELHKYYPGNARGRVRYAVVPGAVDYMHMTTTDVYPIIVLRGRIFSDVRLEEQTSALLDLTNNYGLVIYRKFNIEQCRNILPTELVVRQATAQAIMDRRGQNS